MATVEDIISMVIIITVILVAGLLFAKTYSSKIISKERYAKQFTIEDNYGGEFDTLLELTETNTRRTFGELLASAAYYRTDSVETAERRVSIRKEFERALDVGFPRGNYYFELGHGIDAINMTFIVDGSNSTHDESEILAAGLQSALEDIKSSEEFNGMEISAQVKILQEKNSSWCDIYTVPCSYMRYDEIYFNKTYTVFDMAKSQHGLLRPYYFDEDPEVWMSDWETAMASMALRINDIDMSTLTAYFPVTDALPGATQYFYPCPDDYTSGILSRDQDIFSSRKCVINPIFSVNVEPILYCNDKVISQMKALASVTDGHVIRSRNFVPRIKEALVADIENIRIKAGHKRLGDQYALERRLPMPNGKYVPAYLRVYPN